MLFAIAFARNTLTHFVIPDVASIICQALVVGTVLEGQDVVAALAALPTAKAGPSLCIFCSWRLTLFVPDTPCVIPLNTIKVRESSCEKYLCKAGIPERMAPELLS